MSRFAAVLPIILSIALFSVCSAASRDDPPTKQSVRESLVQGNSAFAADLYGELGAVEGNLFFSPYSISSALAMTYAGARGNTAREMRAALHFPPGQAGLPAAFRRLTGELTAAAAGGQKLDIANGLVLTGGRVSAGYKAVLKSNFDAEIFSGGVTGINDWVRRKTGGKIEKILDELNPNSVCVLLNAIYFKGVWEKRFDPENTREAPFTVAQNRQVKVPLMHRHDSFGILEERDFQAVSLPYKGNRLSMVVLLPRAADGLTALEKQVTGRNLKEWLARLDRQQPRTAYLYLPKFRLETGSDLTTPCGNLGMKDAFTPEKADFRGMGRRRGDLWISQIRHTACVEVNEEGTAAAAATGIEMATKAFRPEPVFRADHPFLFLIRDSRRNTILFLGRMVNPGK